MIRVLIAVHKEKDMTAFHALCSYGTALEGDEELAVDLYGGDEAGALPGKRGCFFHDNPWTGRIPDIILFEIKHSKDIGRLKELRGCFPKAELMVITERKVPVESYLNCAIKPSEVLFRPVDKRSFTESFHRVYGSLRRRREEESGRDFLMVRVGGDIRYLQCSHIIFVEAYDKKLHLHYGEEEIVFYGSLKQLERRLPARFVRCHRAYIINTFHISHMDMSQMTVALRQGFIIPVSQSRRKLLHEKMRGNIMQKDGDKRALKG